MIYVASPYSHPSEGRRELRFLQVSNYVADLLRRKEWCYSPIVHCHELAITYKLPTDAMFWADYNHHVLQRCDEVHILMLKDWEYSKGINMERAWAREFSKPVLMVDGAPYETQTS